MSDPLSDVLGAAPPASVAALPDSTLSRLADQIHSARRHQHDVVEKSVRAAVKGVPLPVRAIVRKALL